MTNQVHSELLQKSLFTVLHLLILRKLFELDDKGGPKFAYGRIIRENCERRPRFSAGRFSLTFGDEGHRKGYCLYKLGCKGPETYANCPIQLFNDAGDLKANMFILENLLYIVPTIILLSPTNRSKPRLLFISAVLMLLAGAVYRFNVFLVGFDPGPGWHYSPFFSEIMITVGIISVKIMAYMIFVKKLPVLPSLRHA